MKLPIPKPRLLHSWGSVTALTLPDTWMWLKENQHKFI